MSKRCAACDRIYPDNAVYCALCGKTLAPEETAACGPATCCGSSGGTRGLAVLVAAVLVGLTAVAVFKASGSTRGEPVYTGPIVNGEVELPECKGDPFFKMLAPQSVKVRVGRSDCCIEVSGSPKELAALSNFAELLNRYHGVSEKHVRARLSKMKRDMIGRDYKLPKGQARALFNLLAHDDVAVWVAWSGRKVTVQALPDDQKTVAYVAKILNGKRLH